MTFPSGVIVYFMVKAFLVLADIQAKYRGLFALERQPSELGSKH